MKKNDFKNLKTKKTEDLRKVVSEKKNELIKLISNKSSKTEKNVKKAKNLKREVSQILTLIREMEIINKEGDKDVK